MDSLHASTGAVGLDYPGPHARRYPHRVGNSVSVQTEQHGGRRGGRQGAADRSRMQPVLEEDRVPYRRVVGGHSEPYTYLVTGGHRGHQLGAAGVDRFSSRQGRGHHRGRRVQHRREMGVIEVEGMAMGPVDQRSDRGGEAVGFTPDRRLRHAPLAASQGQGRPARVFSRAARATPITSRMRSRTLSATPSVNPRSRRDAAK